MPAFGAHGFAFELFAGEPFDQRRVGEIACALKQIGDDAAARCDMASTPTNCARRSLSLT